MKELLVEDLFAEDEAEKLVFLQQLSHVSNLPVVCQLGCLEFQEEGK
jgi:hypothetical protein